MSTSEDFADAALHAVPLTLDGAVVLHQMMRFEWPSWSQCPDEERREIAGKAAVELAKLEGAQDGGSAFYYLLGNKSDLLFVHFRRTFEEIFEVQLKISGLSVGEFLEPADAFLSVVELGLYESSAKLYAKLAAQRVAPHSEVWEQAVRETLETQAKAMAPRLYPEIPEARYICFYPMDRRRGEVKNWYQTPMEERRRMMHEHGLVGRRYAGQVKQIISGAIGFADWEWGVDLFADDPKLFKRLIYEMRFDEVSAVYAEFGPFYVGQRFAAADIGELLAGRRPEWKGRLRGE